MSATFGVGQSKARAWANCRKAYDYKYAQQLIRVRVKRPLQFGKIVHRVIEAEAQEEDWREILKAINFDNEKLFTSEREMYGEIIDDITIIMEEYFKFHNDGLRLLPVLDAEEGYRYAEHEFAIPLEELVPRSRRKDVSGILFKGQVDGLGITRNKMRWLVEHKTFDNLPSDDDRWRNVQSVVYFHAVLHLGWMKSIDGVCWNYVRSHAPTVPKLLKDGTRLSVQQITTLPSVVEAAIKIHNLSRDAHEEHLARAHASRKDYFQRIYTPANSEITENIFNGFVETAIDMRDNHGRRKDRNIGRHCGWCDYEPLCRAELTGGDVDFVREGEFTREDPEAYRRSGRKPKEEKAEGVVVGSAAGRSRNEGTASEKSRGTRSPKLRIVRS